VLIYCSSTEDEPQVPERHNKLVAAVGSVIREELERQEQQTCEISANIVN